MDAQTYQKIRELTNQLEDVRRRKDFAIAAGQWINKNTAEFLTCFYNACHDDKLFREHLYKMRNNQLYELQKEENSIMYEIEKL